MLTDEQLAEIRWRVEPPRPGPWKWDGAALNWLGVGAMIGLCGICAIVGGAWMLRGNR